MKFLFKLVFRLFFVLVVIAIAAWLAKDWVFRTLAERQISAATKLETHIGKFAVSLTRPVIQVENLRLYNSAEFGGAPLVDVPELHAEYDAAALAAGRLRIRLLRLNLAEVNLVRSRAGQTNVMALGQKLQAAQPPAGGSQFRFEQIDTLNLTLGKFRYTDLGNPANSREIIFNVQNQPFQNIRSQDDVYGMAMILLLKNGSLLQQFLGQAQGAASESGVKMKQAAEHVRDLLKK